MLEEEENEMFEAACPHGDQVEAELEALIEANRRGYRCERSRKAAKARWTKWRTERLASRGGST